MHELALITQDLHEFGQVIVLHTRLELAAQRVVGTFLQRPAVEVVYREFQLGVGKQAALALIGQALETLVGASARRARAAEVAAAAALGFDQRFDR